MALSSSATAHELAWRRGCAIAAGARHRSGRCSLGKPRVLALHLDDFLLKSLCFQEWPLCLSLQERCLLSKPPCLILEAPSLLLLLTSLPLLGGANLPQNLLPLDFCFILCGACRLLGVPVAVRAEAMGDGATRADLRRLVPSFHVFGLLLP